ncbi:protein LKAAEAR1 [Bombina bombina]|uniref:protein LKAAEAR1 n=1 Tax=Bombina bombina TaxID=8345 RepID=UPI00235AC6DC|nr:protein LKAAEAR1 [Bombina bombina]XP_053566115.1 protein LKAAEAR1 [Bombina bombina]
MASGNSDRNEKFAAKKSKPIAQGDMKKMVSVQKARYLAYEQPSKEVEASLHLTQTRLKEHALKSYSEPSRKTQDPEQEKQAKVIGQLKAAEARSRIRLMRFRFQCMRAQELKHLIACQPTARDAIRLEVFLPSRPDTGIYKDSLDRVQRERVEELLEDGFGLLTNRIP